MITLDEFITCLQACGWKSTGDAQHEAVKVFHECLCDNEAKALRDARPRTWSAGDVGSAPEGEYLLGISGNKYWDENKRSKADTIRRMEIFPELWTQAFGPYLAPPRPPVAAVTDGRGEG